MPFPMKKKINAKAAMVALVSKCIDNVLKKHAVTEASKIVLNEDFRIEVAMDVCDDILRTLQRRREK
jgi:hypothetical protein